jgi:hypothetical protein
MIAKKYCNSHFALTTFFICTQNMETVKYFYLNILPGFIILSFNFRYGLRRNTDAGNFNEVLMIFFIHTQNEETMKNLNRKNSYWYPIPVSIKRLKRFLKNYGIIGNVFSKQLHPPPLKKNLVLASCKSWVPVYQMKIRTNLL